MTESLKHRILEFHPDTIRAVRESCGLDAPGRVDEAIDMIREWVAKQEHFLKKDFPRSFLETCLIMSKGSVEKCKQRLDLICTMRTFAPQFFGKYDALNDFKAFHSICKAAPLPKPTDDHYRVGVLKLTGNYYPDFFQDLYQYLILVAEYFQLHDHCKGFVFVVDVTDINLMEFITKIDLIELRNCLTLATKGYGTRIKSIHFLTHSKTIEIFISMMKQVISAKITSRMSVQKTFEELHQHLPKRILPEDLGGEERSTEKLEDEWLEVFSSEEHIRHMKEMQEARTDEARRRAADLLNPVFGLPGTFRALHLD